MVFADTGIGMVWSQAYATAPDLHFLLTDFFSAVLQDARNNEATIVGMIPEASQRISGKFFLEPVKFGRNPRAFGFVREGAAFPDPSVRKSRMYSNRVCQQMVRFVVDGDFWRTAEGGDTQVVDPIMQLFADWSDDYLIDLAFVMHSDGSGRRAEVDMTANWTSATQTGDADFRPNFDIADGQGSVGAAAATGVPDQPGTMYLEIGGRYAIVSSAGVVRQYFQVNSIVDANTANITTIGAGGAALNAIPGLATGDWITKVSNDDSTPGALGSQSSLNTAYRREPVGLGGIFGFEGIFNGLGPTAEVGMPPATMVEDAAYAASTWSGTENYAITAPDWFQGLPARSAAASWTGDLTFNQGITGNGGGATRTPTESLIQRFLTTVRKTNNAKIEAYLSQPEVKDTYLETLLPEKRYVNTVEMKGGWDPSTPGPEGIAWPTDRWCFHNRLYCLAFGTGGVEQKVRTPMRLATKGDEPAWQYHDDFDKHQIRWIEEYQIHVGVRNRCGGVLLELKEA